MTAPERLSDTAPWGDWFERAMNSRAPIVDNASERLYAIGELEYDGPRCAAEDCDTAVENENHDEFCEECADQPHEFIHDGGYRDNWCICGRIRSIGGYSPVHTDEPTVCPACRGAGGWQQHDGLIVECPRGCMTDGSAA